MGKIVYYNTYMVLTLEDLAYIQVQLEMQTNMESIWEELGANLIIN